MPNWPQKAAQYKSKARRNRVNYDLDPDYLKMLWDGLCAISGLSISHEFPPSDEYAAELDRVVPSRGYVKGNVRWVSRRYNRIKNDALLGEVLDVARYIERNMRVR